MKTVDILSSLGPRLVAMVISPRILRPRAVLPVSYSPHPNMVLCLLLGLLLMREKQKRDHP